MQLNWGEIQEGRKSKTESINCSPGLGSLTENFSERYIVGQWLVACEYRMINRCIAGAMNLLA